MSVFCSESSSESSVFWIKIFLLWFEAASSSIKILFLVLTNFTIEVKFLFKWTLVILWANVFAMFESKFPFSGKSLFPWVVKTIFYSSLKPVFPWAKAILYLRKWSFPLRECYFFLERKSFPFEWKELFF